MMLSLTKGSRKVSVIATMSQLLEKISEVTRLKRNTRRHTLKDPTNRPFVVGELEKVELLTVMDLFKLTEIFVLSLISEANRGRQSLTLVSLEISFSVSIVIG